RLSGQRLGRRLRLLREHRIRAAIEDALDANFEPLPDGARRVGDDYLEAVGVTDRRSDVVAVDLAELEPQLGAFLQSRRRGDVEELALGEDDEVIEMRFRLAGKEEPLLRDRLELDQPPRTGADEGARDRVGQLDAERLRSRARGERP